MPAKEIIIDGPIGPFYISKKYIRNELDGNKKNPILAKISSLGGAVDDALNIYDQFKAHGNVTAQLSAFVASSATLISLGAKHIQMNEFAFYLAHKPMRWVDEWGTLNEDEIEDLIQKLTKDKDELSKVTLQLVKMYMKKSGKTSDEIIDVMQQETWLTAEEALSWGFIDEIYTPDTIEDFTENHKLVAMLTANGFPPPPRSTHKHNEDSIFNRVWNKFQKKQADFSNSNQNKNSMKTFKNVNSILKVDALESVENHVSLNETQLGLIDQKIAGHNDVVAERDTAIQERDTATQERDTAKSSLTQAEKDRDTAKADLTKITNERDTAKAEVTSVTSVLDELDDTIKEANTPAEKAEAVRTLLAERPGKQTPGALQGDGNNDDSDENWDIIDNLPHNKSVDTNS